MRFIRLLTLLAVSPLLTACVNEPIGPDSDQPLFAVSRTEEVSEWDEDFWDYVSCANDGNGEWMHWTGPYTVTVSRLTTPAGNTQIIPTVEYHDAFQLEGGTSGEVWSIIPDKSRVNQIVLQMDNGNMVRNSVWLEYYENGEGDELFVQTSLHVTVANGELRLFRVGVNACSLKN
jgi:hypothetical protein